MCRINQLFNKLCFYLLFLNIFLIVHIEKYLSQLQYVYKQTIKKNSPDSLSLPKDHILSQKGMTK